MSSAVLDVNCMTVVEFLKCHAHLLLGAIHAEFVKLSTILLFVKRWLARMSFDGCIVFLESLSQRLFKFCERVTISKQEVATLDCVCTSTSDTAAFYRLPFCSREQRSINGKSLCFSGIIKALTFSARQQVFLLELLCMFFSLNSTELI